MEHREGKDQAHATTIRSEKTRPEEMTKKKKDDKTDDDDEDDDDEYQQQPPDRQRQRQRQRKAGSDGSVSVRSLFVRSETATAIWREMR